MCICLGEKNYPDWEKGQKTKAPTLILHISTSSFYFKITSHRIMPLSLIFTDVLVMSKSDNN